MVRIAEKPAHPSPSKRKKACQQKCGDPRLAVATQNGARAPRLATARVRPRLERGPDDEKHGKGSAVTFGDGSALPGRAAEVAQCQKGERKRRVFAFGLSTG